MKKGWPVRLIIIFALILSGFATALFMAFKDWLFLAVSGLLFLGSHFLEEILRSEALREVLKG